MNAATQVTGLWGWREHAACAGMDVNLFYPDYEQERDLDALRTHTAMVQRICSTCPVQVECLQEGMHVSEGAGIWGGLTSNARRRLRYK